MNKISKKIVALVTMAAFVLTLVPMAAFAAEPTDSYVSLAEDNVDVNTPVAVSLKDANGSDVKPGADLGEKIYVWAEKVDGDTSTPTRNVEYTVNGSSFSSNGNTTYLSNGLAAIIDNAGDLNKLSIKFTAAGDYVVKAGVSFSEANPTSTSDIVTFVGEKNTITVDAASVGDVDKLTFDAGSGENEATGGKITLDPIKDNNTATKTYTVKAYIGSDAAANEKFTIEADNGLTVTAKDPISGETFDAGTATTNRKGEFQITYSASKAGTLKMYFTSEDGYLVIASVKAGEVEADYPANIETTLEKGQILNVDESYTDYVDAVQFKITDQNGDEMTGDEAIATEPAHTGDKDYVKVLSKPSKFKVADDKAPFKLVWNSDKGVYTLAANNSTLVEGEYTVRVAVDKTGNYADASFTVDKFGVATGIKIKFTSKNVTDENQVAINANVTGKVVLVDANGIEQDAKDANVSVGYTGTAVDGKPTMTAQNISFSVKDATTEEETLKLVGTPITITAINEAKGFVDQVTLTVVDKANVEGTSLSFNSDNGPARETNAIVAQVINSDEEAIKTINNGKMYAFVDSQTNSDAHIELTPATSISNGKGTLKVYSDKETQADIVVAIRDNDTNKIYAKTLTYTFGPEDAVVSSTVVMTIGSSDFVVNNDVVTVEDSAPYVAKDRTFVPFRALGEAIGAEVVWDNDARTVTYTLGKTEIVMTIGETSYTVNGEEKTMDVAPEITGDRTYVPVRFVGEALGFKVTALYAADGTTASVLFQK